MSESKSPIIPLSNISNHSNEANNYKSTVSFNNAKNFSIYKQVNNNNISRQNEVFLNDQPSSNEVISSPSFKERLDQIDMK